MTASKSIEDPLLNFLNPTYEKLLEASKKPIIGIIPSALQGAIGLVQIVAGAFFGLTSGALYLELQKINH